MCSTWFVDVIEPLCQFVDGAYHSTRTLSSTAWAIYDPNGELVNLQGICLGRTTNNIAEYSAVISFCQKLFLLELES